jgi:hypothetical protein
MTIGLIALRAAKDQLVAAIATIKDELKNPDLAETIKFEVYNLGSDFDDHLTELGNAMPSMFRDKTAQVERSNVEEGLYLLDPTQESGLVDGLTVEPATDGNPALEPGIDAPTPSPSDGKPSAEDLDKVAEEQKAAAATGAELAEHHKGLGERIKEIVDGAGNAIGEAKFNIC